MNYKKIYDDLITSRKLIIYDDKTYTERHHILPKCLGGSNDENNMIRLSYRDHYIAHLLLFKSSKNLNIKFRMAAALHCLTKSNNNLRSTNSKLYETNMVRFKTSMLEFYRSSLGKEYIKRRSIASTMTRTQKFKFDFYHEKFESFSGSCYDLMKLYPDQKLNSSNLGKVGKEERTSHKGWILLKNKSIGVKGFLDIKHEKMSKSAVLRGCPTKGLIHLNHSSMKKRIVKPFSEEYNDLISKGYYSKNGKHGIMPKVLK